MSRAPANDQGHEQLPAFNPADWVGEATRVIDVAEDAEPLLNLLTAHETWDPLAKRDPQRNEVVRELADALKPRTPLYELAAALITPYLLTALPPYRRR